MKKFTYEIKDQLGIHARPAGMLVKEAKKFESSIVIRKEEKESGATKLMALMGLGVKCGDKIEVEISGPDEEQAFEEMQSFFSENL